jgi:hypothetical protein
MDNTLIYLAAFVTLGAAAVATAILVVRRDGVGVGDLIKQLLLWVTIAALLPLTSWAGATMLHPRTQLKELMAQDDRLEAVFRFSTDNESEARKKNSEEREKLRILIEEEKQKFYRAMFWIGYPIGLTTLIVGLYLRTLAVGTGMAFGGLCTLATGCYSYWDDMGDGLRFFSLLLVLALTIAIGLLKFGRSTTA